MIGLLTELAEPQSGGHGYERLTLLGHQQSLACRFLLAKVCLGIEGVIVFSRRPSTIPGLVSRRRLVQRFVQPRGMWPQLHSVHRPRSETQVAGFGRD